MACSEPKALSPESRCAPVSVGARWVSALTYLERFLTVMDRRGFPTRDLSNSGSTLVLEAGMDGSSIVGRSSIKGRGGDRECLSRRQAAARSGVSAASAIRWQQLAAQHGTPEPPRQGGDRRLARIEAYANLILGAYEATPSLIDSRCLVPRQGVTVSAAGGIYRMASIATIPSCGRPSALT